MLGSTHLSPLLGCVGLACSLASHHPEHLAWPWAMSKWRRHILGVWGLYRCGGLGVSPRDLCWGELWKAWNGEDTGAGGCEGLLRHGWA